TSPRGSGMVDVTVTTAVGTSVSSAADKFSYLPPPVVTSVTPNRGPLNGGTRVSISGTRLASTYRVLFGTTPAATLVVSSDSQVLATSPPGAGVVDVTVIASVGRSESTTADKFTYLAPSGLPA